MQSNSVAVFRRLFSCGEIWAFSILFSSGKQRHYLLTPDYNYKLISRVINITLCYGLRQFENRMLRQIFVSNKEQEGGENCIIGSFITCICHQILIGLSNVGELDG